MRFLDLLQTVARGTRRGLRHPAARVARVICIGIIGAWLAVLVAGGLRASIGLATLHGTLRPALHGQTTLALPPFGTLSARTHRAPVALTIQVDELHMKELVDWAKEGPSKREAVGHLREQLERLAWDLGERVLLAALLGAVACGLLLGLRRWALAGGALAGVVAVMIPLVLTAVTFRPSAFATPTYQGELSRAPELLQAAQQAWRQYARLEERLPVVIDQIVTFYRQVDEISVLPATQEAGYRRVLLISDLHNNPLGMQFALNLAREYRVDLVLVAGDVTDYGHPLEADLQEQWRNFAVPVAVITGNHDSRLIAKRLATLPGVTLLENGDTRTYHGLTVMGFGDPRAGRETVGDVTPRPEELAALQTRIRATLSTTPDVLMVHNNAVAERLLGTVPVIVTGHSHQARVMQRGGSVMINPGTTGAAGLRYFTGRTRPTFGAAVLHFAQEGRRPALQLVDLIAVDEPAGNFSIRRLNVAEAPGPGTATAGAAPGWVME